MSFLSFICLLPIPLHVVIAVRPDFADIELLHGDTKGSSLAEVEGPSVVCCCKKVNLTYNGSYSHVGGTNQACKWASASHTGHGCSWRHSGYETDRKACDEGAHLPPDFKFGTEAWNQKIDSLRQKVGPITADLLQAARQAMNLVNFQRFVTFVQLVVGVGFLVAAIASAPVSIPVGIGVSVGFALLNTGIKIAAGDTKRNIAGTIGFGVVKGVVMNLIGFEVFFEIGKTAIDWIFSLDALCGTVSSVHGMINPVVDLGNAGLPISEQDIVVAIKERDRKAETVEEVLTDAVQYFKDGLKGYLMCGKHLANTPAATLALTEKVFAK